MLKFLQDSNSMPFNAGHVMSKVFVVCLVFVPDDVSGRIFVMR